MAGDTVITIVGNVTGDPELRFTPSGAAVANFTVASTPRAFDRQSNEWKDGETLFMRCSVWRDAAENVAESLQRGTRVIVTGRLKSRSYETKEGEKRTVVELDASVARVATAVRLVQVAVARHKAARVVGAARRRPTTSRRSSPSSERVSQSTCRTTTSALTTPSQRSQQTLHDTLISCSRRHSHG